MDLDTVAAQLYALDPGEFTRARTERERQAKTAGDKELARQIHQLRKPTVTAWLANLLARERPDALRPLRELGARLREAQHSLQGDELRELSRQRHRLVYILVREARELAGAHDQKVSEQVARELEQTLEATLADPTIADSLLAGRLTSAVQHTGFGPGSAVAVGGRPNDKAAESTPKQAAKPRARSGSGGAAGAGAGAESGAESGAGAGAGAAAGSGSAAEDVAKRKRAAVRAAAERDVEDAAQGLRAAVAVATSAARAAEELDRRQSRLAEQITEFEESLRQAERELPSVRHQSRQAGRDLDRAEQARERAERILGRAREALAGLD